MKKINHLLVTLKIILYKFLYKISLIKFLSKFDIEKKLLKICLRMHVYKKLHKIKRKYIFTNMITVA